MVIPNSSLILLLRIMLAAQFLGAGLGAFLIWRVQSDALQTQVYQDSVSTQTELIHRRVSLVENELRAVRALYSSSREVDSSEFRSFVDSSNIEVVDSQKASRFLKAWFWISAISNANEPTFYFDHVLTLTTTTDRYDIRLLLDQMYRGDGESRQFAVPVEYLGLHTDPLDTTIGIVQPVFNKRSNFNPKEKLRGYIVGIVDFSAIVGLQTTARPNSDLKFATFTSQFTSLGVKNDIEPLPPALRNQTAISAYQPTNSPLADGHILLTWYAMPPSVPISITPLRATMFGGLCLLTFIGWRVTSRIETLNNSLKRERDRSDAAAHEKSRFLANMSHEIRTPLNAIVGMGDLIGKGTLSPKQKEYLHELHWSVDGLTKLIDNILDFSKLEAGQAEVDATVNNITTFFSHVSNSVGTLAKARGIDHYFALDPHLPEHAVFDGHRLRQVCLNLLTNAIKFTHSGYVAFTVQPVNGKTVSDNFWIEIVVKDSGIGIPDSAKGRLFERFSQVDNSTTRQFGGSGLGLSIVKQLVSLLGGTIDLQSKVGEGSRFSVCLPMAHVIPGEHAVCTTATIHGDNGSPTFPAAKVATARPLKVLIAEDDRVNRLYIGELLLSLGHNCEFAEDGYSAYQKAITHSFDIVFMDCQMPVWDGYTTTEQLRKALCDSYHLPIIALTAHALPGEPEKCRNAGMSDFMTKPVRESTLVAMLEKWAPGKFVADSKLQKPSAKHAPPILEVLHNVVAANSEFASTKETARKISTTNYPQVVSASNDQLIDRATIDQLRQSMGGSFTNLIRCFVEDLSHYEQELRSSYAKAAYADVARIAHTLKSSSTLIGAQTLNEQARDFEELLVTSEISEQTAGVNEALSALIDTMQRLSMGLQSETLAAA